MLTRLLFATASILKIIYEEPSTPLTLDPKAVSNSSPNDGPGHSSEESKTENPMITAADLDDFESYLSSNRTPGGQHDAISVDRLREQAMERILEQENELNAEIQALSHAGDVAERRCSPVPTRSPLTLPEKKDQNKAANQDAWLAQLLSHKGSKSSPSSGGALKSTGSNAHSETRSNHNCIYSAKQLAEAASFAKAVSRKSTVTNLHTPKPQRTGRPGNALINAKSALPPHLRKLHAAKAAKNLVDSEGEQGRATSETITQAIKADGEMSIDTLKALDPKLSGRPRRPRLPGSFVAGVERSIRIIAGKEEGLQRTLRRSEPEGEHVTRFSDETPVQNEANQVYNLHVDHHSFGEQDKLRQSDIKQSPPWDPNLAQDFHHQNELTDEAPDGDKTGLIEDSSLYDEFHNDQDKDDQEAANQDLTGQPQSCYRTVIDMPNEAAGTAGSQPPIVSNKTSSNNAISLELPERRALFKEMADLFNKSVEKNQTSATTTVDDRKSSNADTATRDAIPRSGGHELDLVGLDFSTETTSPTGPVQAAKPQLQASSREFAPGTTLLRDWARKNEIQEKLKARLAQSEAASRLKKKREAEAAAAAVTASKEAEQTFVVPQHPYWPDPFSGSAFSFLANADMMPMRSHTAPYPGSTYLTPLGSSEHVWQAPTPQPHAQMDHPTAGYSTSRFDLSIQQQPPQYLPSAPTAPIHMKPPPIFKGVAIEKPVEVKFNENFPQLPSTKPSIQNVQVHPPPGLGDSKGSSQTPFDALLSGQKIEKAPGVATSNPFDALLQTGNSMQHSAKATSNEVSHHDQSQDAGVESDAQSKATQKKRKQVRTDLAIAWVQRESIRKRIVGTYTLDSARALTYATKTYNDLRSHLASLMATGELREEDAKMFEYFSTSELRVPSVGVTTIRKLIPDDKIELSSVVASKTSAVQDMKENKCLKRSDVEIAELTKKAIDARNVYAEAHACFTRPQSRNLKAQGEARVDRAARFYAQAREQLAAAYGGALPAEMKEKLWTYDHVAMKKSRNS